MRQFQPGEEIDGFTLVERLPSGGMASIWRATRPDLDGPLILKIPFLDPGQDVSTIIGYEMEEMIHRRLVGPHVPRFVGSGDLARTPYIAMEWVAGLPLKAMVERAPLPAEEVARIGGLIAEALVDLHGQDVVHLDLKPENVILAEPGAVLLDFGLARHGALPDLLGEESTVPMGSPVTIAPEQVLGERGDPASDLFALGCILYQLSTGTEPFGQPSTLAGMKRRLFHAPKPARSLNPRLPAWLDAIIARCLEVDRSRRYADAGQLLFDLRHPEQVVVASVAGAATRETWLGRLLGKPDERALTGSPTHSRRRAGPSIILSAIDLASGSTPLGEAVRAETARLLAARPDSALAAVSVLRTEIIASAEPTDAEGRSLYIARLVALKEWARPLCLPDNRVSYHVLEAVDAAEAILRYAALNHVDHIVIGARSSSMLRRHLGSVSTKVVAEAHCSVSVVRVSAAPAIEDAGAA